MRSPPALDQRQLGLKLTAKRRQRIGLDPMLAR
jgi:hypothetical protein